jgi:DNA-binding NarL/FixJ family response regulator
VTVVESQASFAEALRATLERAGFTARLVNTNAPAAALVSAVMQQGPDVVILGSGLDFFGDGAQLVMPLVEAGISVVVLASHADDPMRWGMYLTLGAKTVIRRTVPLERFLTIIRDVAEGSFVPSREEQRLLRLAGEREATERRELLQRISRLSPREREILLELMQGRTATEIATAGFVAEATVRTQIKVILQKLEVSSQLAAVAVAHKAGVSVEPPGPSRPIA